MLLNLPVKQLFSSSSLSHFTRDPLFCYWNSVKNILLSPRNHPFVKRHNELSYVTKFNAVKRFDVIWCKTFAFSFNLTNILFIHFQLHINKNNVTLRSQHMAETKEPYVCLFLFFCTTANQVEDCGLFVLICLKCRWSLYVQTWLCPIIFCREDLQHLPYLHLLAQTLFRFQCFLYKWCKISLKFCLCHHMSSHTCNDQQNRPFYL